MKQILQDLRSGKLELADIPSPAIGSGNVRIQTRNSLVSAGTERMLVEFSQANLLQKARSQPDKVKQVLDKIKSDGLLPTLETVFSRLDEPLPLGYSNAGVVLESDSAVSEFQPGDRVVSNGRHAEIVTAAENLLAGIPDNVSDEEASFTVISSIGLQGVRLTQPTLGERFVVFGL
ncbi:MAG: dehydrogenase, partial [Verrucomicrobiota bacterium]